MKVIKVLVALITGLIALMLVVAALIPSQYALERDIVINNNKSEVFSYIKYLKNQANYSTWAKMDLDMKKNYKGTDGQVGFISAWESDMEQVGKGEQEILEIVDGERINTELRFLEPFEATDSAYMTTESLSENTTRVVWGFAGNMAYPMNLLLLTMNMDKEIGTHLEQGLMNLKVILEK